MRNLAIVSTLTLLMACHRSGTWVDDPGNFKRAWGTEPPAGVQVVHSWYWRSGHFTREEIYYFQLRAEEAYAEAFAAENHLEVSSPSELGQLSFADPKPVWFAPKDPTAYRIWSTGSQESPGFVLADRGTGDIFIYFEQL